MNVSDAPVEPHLDVPSYCRNDSSDQSTEKAIGFWVEGVALSSCALVGIVGNILTCIVLYSISLKNVFNQLIVILCVVDTLFNTFSIVEYSLRKSFDVIKYTTPIYVSVWPKVIYPMHNITSSASLCITLAIAIERYLAVCHPFFVHQEQAVGSNGAWRAFKKRTWRYLLPALLFAISINVPKFLEFENYTGANNRTSIKATELRFDSDYQFYYINWTRTTLTAIVPFLLLAFLNGKIIVQIRKAEKMCTQASSGVVSERETKLARILVLLVFTFLFCNLGKLFLNLYDIGHLAKIQRCDDLNLQFIPPLWVLALTSINHLLIVVNSSTNLFLFALIGTQFRSMLLVVLHLRPAIPGRSNFKIGSPPITQRTLISHSCEPNEATTMV